MTTHHYDVLLLKLWVSNCDVRGGVMQKHRVVITFATIVILLSFFCSQSEGRSFCAPGKICGGLLFNQWHADGQHPLIYPKYSNIFYKETGGVTPFYSRSDHYFFYAKRSHISGEKDVFSKWNQYTRTSQRPPPLS